MHNKCELTKGLPYKKGTLVELEVDLVYSRTHKPNTGVIVPLAWNTYNIWGWLVL